MYVWRKYKYMAWRHTKSLTKVSSGEGRRDGKGANERMKLSRKSGSCGLPDPKASLIPKSLPTCCVQHGQAALSPWTYFMPGLLGQEADPPGPLLPFIIPPNYFLIFILQ